MCGDGILYESHCCVQLTYAKEKVIKCTLYLEVKIKRWYVLLFKNMYWGSVNSKIARDKSTC